MKRVHDDVPMPSNVAWRLAEALISTLPVSAPGLFNPWREVCEFDSSTNTIQSKQTRLSAHLDCDARWILVGEAPGYQGCRYSGIAFTSEKLLLEGVIPRVGKVDHRLTTRDRIFSEPSATVVWRTLHCLGIAEQVVLWNALQLHPHKPGTVWSNRTPSKMELEYGIGGLTMLMEHFKRAKIVAVGRKAEGILAMAGVREFASVRHPSMGGARAFATQLAALAVV